MTTVPEATEPDPAEPGSTEPGSTEHRTPGPGSPEPRPTTEPDPADGAGDDYGYDLAHEVKDALQIPVTRRRRPATPSGTGRPAEQDGDLGYDDAHEIRGS